jgi:hypothetical protein
VLKKEQELYLLSPQAPPWHLVGLLYFIRRPALLEIFHSVTVFRQKRLEFHVPTASLSEIFPMREAE